jgi:hypothetical protein
LEYQRLDWTKSSEHGETKGEDHLAAKAQKSKKAGKIRA